MNFIIKTKDLQLTPAIEKYVQKKIDSLQKFVKDANRGPANIEVEIGKTTRHHQTGNIFMAEINLSLGGKFFRAESERDTLYSAIDEIRDDLEQQIKKFKDKKDTIFIRGARSLKKKFGLDDAARFRNKS